MKINKLNFNTLYMQLIYVFKGNHKAQK